MSATLSYVEYQCLQYWSCNTCKIHWLESFSSSWNDRWTTSTYSSLAARQTVDSLQVGSTDIQDTSYINSDYTSHYLLTYLLTITPLFIVLPIHIYDSKPSLRRNRKRFKLYYYYYYYYCFCQFWSYFDQIYPIRFLILIIVYRILPHFY